MAVIHAFPENLIGATQGTFDIQYRRLLSVNPWTRFRRGADGPTDERFVAQISRKLKSKEEVDDALAFFARTDGMSGYFTFYDPWRPWPLGKAAGGNPHNGGVTTTTFDDATTFDDGTLFVEGSGHAQVAQAMPAGSEFIKLSGLVASQAVAIAANDRLSIRLPGQAHGYLHMAVGDSASDASGEALVSIRPRLRRPAGVNQQVELHKPRGVFQLQDEESLVQRRLRLGTLEMTLVEAFEVIEL